MGIVCGLLGIIDKGVGNAWGIFDGWGIIVMLRLLIVVGYCLDRSLSWMGCASIIRPFKTRYQLRRHQRQENNVLTDNIAPLKVVSAGLR